MRRSQAANKEDKDVGEILQKPGVIRSWTKKPD